MNCQIEFVSSDSDNGMPRSNRELGRIRRTRRVTRVEKWLARINANDLDNLVSGGEN
jgi:hypothetical protein